LPIAQTAPSGARRAASRTAAAERVRPAAAASPAAAGVPTRQIDGYADTPAATIRTSTTSGAPARSASAPAASACSSRTRSHSQAGSAVVWMIRSATSRLRGGSPEVSTVDRMIR
jgi:hypothetical protein